VRGPRAWTSLALVATLAAIAPGTAVGWGAQRAQRLDLASSCASALLRADIGQDGQHSPMALGPDG
jgi:hypothetical protein